MLTNFRYHLILVALLLASSLSFGQEVKLEGLRMSGKLKDMGQGVLQVEGSDGETWLVKIEVRNKSELSYAGTAEPDWIRPGMWIQFQANVTGNRRYEVEGPVDQLTVFTPTKDTQLGIIPDSQLGAGLFDEKKPAEQVDKNAPVPCTVRGRIAGIKKNKISVAAGKAALTIEVPDDVRVTVEVADLSVAQPGDSVEIEGWKYPMVPGRAIANRVTITGDKPLTGAKPKRTRGSDDKKKKGDDKPDLIDTEKGASDKNDKSDKKSKKQKEKEPEEKDSESEDSDN